MKLLKLLLIISLTLFIAPSCDDDDDKGGDKTESIVGTWGFEKTTDFQITVKSNNATFDKYCKLYIQAQWMPDKIVYTFTEDGNFSQTFKFNGYPKEDFGGTYTYKDNVLTINEDVGDEEPEAIPSHAIIKDNVLTITEDALETNAMAEDLIDRIFGFYKEELKDVDKTTLQIEETTYIFKFKKGESVVIDDSDVVIESIIGTWEFNKATDYDFIIQSNNETFNAYCRQYIDTETIFAHQVFVFNENGTYSHTSKFSSAHEEEIDNGTYTYKDNVLTIGTETIPAVIKNNILTLSNDALVEYLEDDIIGEVFRYYPEQLKNIDKNTITITELIFVLRYNKK